MEGQFSDEIQAILAKPVATVDELRLVMGCGRDQAYAFVREGRIKALRVGRRILIPTSAIRVLLGIAPPDAA